MKSKSGRQAAGAMRTRNGQLAAWTRGSRGDTGIKRSHEVRLIHSKSWLVSRATGNWQEADSGGAMKMFATRPSRGSFGFGVSLSGRANPHVDCGRLIDSVFVEDGANQRGVRPNLIAGMGMSAQGPAISAGYVSLRLFAA